MKNLVSLVEKEDVHAYFKNVWKTKAFRDSYESGGFVYQVVEQYAQLPRIVCETTNDYLERAHFSSWWGVTMIRDDYPNPAIHDLYLIHEIFHTGTMPYLPGIGWEAFHRKMEENELDASVASEIQAYFEIPGLREEAFPHEIYADRFLKDPAMQMLWEKNKTIALATMKEARRNVMLSKPEADMDHSERWIRRFAMQNRLWSITWFDSYSRVEAHMHEFQRRALTGDRKKALKFHRDWLKAEAAKDPEFNIPFRSEAALFAPGSWANRTQYNAYYAEQNTRPKGLYGAAKTGAVSRNP